MQSKSTLASHNELLDPPVAPLGSLKTNDFAATDCQNELWATSRVCFIDFLLFSGHRFGFAKMQSKSTLASLGAAPSPPQSLRNLPRVPQVPCEASQGTPSRPPMPPKRPECQPQTSLKRPFRLAKGYQSAPSDSQKCPKQFQGYQSIPKIPEAHQTAQLPSHEVTQ